MKDNARIAAMLIAATLFVISAISILTAIFAKPKPISITGGVSVTYHLENLNIDPTSSQSFTTIGAMLAAAGYPAQPPFTPATKYRYYRGAPGANDFNVIGTRDVEGWGVYDPADNTERTPLQSKDDLDDYIKDLNLNQ